MMIEVILYDTKHRCKVSSEELMPIRLVNEKSTKVIGEYGYKSKKCKPYKNWDRHVMASDLLFHSVPSREAKIKAYLEETE